MHRAYPDDREISAPIIFSSKWKGSGVKALTKIDPLDLGAAPMHTDIATIDYYIA